MALFVQCRPPLIDPGGSIELTCSGLGRIEFLGGGLACYVAYRNAIAVHTGALERQICGRMFAPIEAMPEAIDLMIEALRQNGIIRAARLPMPLMM